MSITVADLIDESRTYWSQELANRRAAVADAQEALAKALAAWEEEHTVLIATPQKAIKFYEARHGRQGAKAND